jgi:hypothetical protein
MGILADLSRSKIKFDDPGTPYEALNAIARQVAFDMHNFAITFAIGFDPDPKQGIGGAPAEAELWRVGIIQNVLFEHLYYEYEGGKIFQTDWKDAAVDIVTRDDKIYLNKPFYNNPDFSPGRAPQRPAADIWYTAQGFGELLNPNSPTGVAVNNRPDTFNIWDEPAGGAKLFKDGAMIRRIEKVLSFQTWLIAKSKVQDKGAIADKIEVIAHIPVFSLAFWLETTPGKGWKAKTSLDVPTYDWAMFGTSGFFDPKAFNRKKTGFGNVPAVMPKSGSGGRQPVLLGPTANDRANKFMTDNGLQ